MRPGERFIKAKNSTHLGPQIAREREKERERSRVVAERRRHYATMRWGWQHFSGLATCVAATNC